MSSLLVLLLLAGDLGAAEKALAAGDPKRAIELLGDLAEQEQPDVRAYVVQGRALLALGEYRAAVEPLLRASDGRPDDKALARDAALACWNSAAGPYAKLYLVDAKRLAERAGDAFLLAELDFTGSDFEQALARYRKLEQTDANRIEILGRIADCLRRIGREEEAKEAFGKLLDEAMRVGDLGTGFRASFAAGRAGLFLNWLDERIAADPEDVDSRLFRGYARTEKLMYEEAIEDLRFVVGRRPQPEVKNRLSYALLQLGVRRQEEALVHEAETLARETLDANAKDQVAWNRLAWIAGHYWANNDIERAYAVLKDLWRRDPEEFTTALNFAAQARRLARYDESRRAYGILLESSPDDPDVLNDLAILEDGVGNHARAVELWRKVIVEDPENLNALENLFTHNWERGNRKAMDGLWKRGMAAAKRRQGPVERWLWFRDRIQWAPSGFAREAGG